MSSAIPDADILRVEYDNLKRTSIHDALGIIKRAAEILETLGHPTEDICAKLCEDFDHYSASYIRQLLPPYYKHKEFDGSGSTGSKAPSLLLRIAKIQMVKICPHCQNQVMIIPERNQVNELTGSLALTKDIKLQV